MISPPMKTSDAGVRFLMAEEGVRNEAYPDPAAGWAIPTIGVGHTGPDVRRGDVWSDDKVMEVLRADLAGWENLICANVDVPLTQNQFDALVSWCHNVGAGAFKGSTLLRKLNAGDYAGASAEFPKWCIPDMLVGRRARERALFDGGAVAVPKPHKTTADVQRALGIVADGIYGPATHAAVLAFQEAHGLVPDGIVGPKTLEALFGEAGQVAA